MAGKDISVSRILKLAQQFNCFYLSGFPYNKFLQVKSDLTLIRQGDLYRDMPAHDFKLRRATYQGLQSGTSWPFIVAGKQVGLVRPDVLSKLSKYPEVFSIQKNCVTLNPAFRDYTERSAKVEEVLKECRAQETFITLKGWRDECFDVRAGYSAEALLKMDRCATCLFGICNYGVDINGYVMDPEKGLCIWLQRRSQTKQTWPGRWDNMVGGGLAVGYGVLETAYKEAEEEASIPSELMKNLRSGGSVSFFFESERGLFPNTEFVFDLELPCDFIPKNNDGEVEMFELLPAKEALVRVLSKDFKTTSCPVVLDFLIRHGIITPDSEPHFPELVELLHVPLQSLYRVRSCAENGEIYSS